MLNNDKNISFLAVPPSDNLIFPQGFHLKLQPQSGRILQPHEQNGVTQVISLMGADHGKGDAVRLRWKASYRVGVKPVSEQGEVPSLGIV